MAPSLFWTLLLSVFFYALLRGTNEQRLAAIGCLVATLASRLFRSQYGSLEVGVLIVDLALFMLFLAIALRSTRFWPLWVAGFHLVAVGAHGMRAIKADLIPTAYAVAAQFWSYPVLLCIGIAVWRYQRRQFSPSFAPTNGPSANA